MEITVDFPGGKKVNARVRDFTIATDQAKESGGEGSAPEPFLYFLAALATCAGHYARSYLDHHGLPWKGMKLIQRHEFDPKTHRLARVEMKFFFPPELEEKHRQAALRAAGNCAVKKVLEAPPEFAITF